MHQVLEALIDETGRVFLAEALRPGGKRRALVIVLDDATVADPPPAKNPDPEAKPPDLHRRYRIERPLAAGGMGEAFVGTDLQTARPVCIKRLRPGVRREILVQEWRSLSRVDSRFVVRLMDWYEHDGSPYLVMEYVDGPTLADKLAAGLGPGEIGWLALGLLRGLAAIHGQNVIHCDLTPRNVLIQDVTVASPGEPGWEPKLIDFGLAVLDDFDAAGLETAYQRFAGTPAFMSPEQIDGLKLSPATDIYAAGLILHEALTRRRAFAADGRSMRKAKMSQKHGLRVKRLPPGVPEAIAELVERCTHPDPSRRPAASEAVALLERCQSSAPEPAR